MSLKRLQSVLACMGVISTLISLVSCDQSAVNSMSHNPRISSHVSTATNNQIYVGWPLDTPTQWEAAVVADGSLQINGNAIDLAEISSFLIVYPNGEVLDYERLFFPLPDGVTFLEKTEEVVQDKLNPSTLVAGSSLLEITHGPSASRPGEPGYYSTSLKNISSVKIRVDKFTAFMNTGNAYVLSTVSGGYFSSEQFIAWYGVPDDGWIQPGQTVSDPNNYGGGDGYWVYFIQTETGDEFSAGTKIPNK